MLYYRKTNICSKGSVVYLYYAGYEDFYDVKEIAVFDTVKERDEWVKDAQFFIRIPLEDEDVEDIINGKCKEYYEEGILWLLGR